MCVVIDTCCLASVFDSRNKRHPNFSPVLKWIAYGNGRMILGGTKYKQELERAPKFLKILSEFEKSRKVIEIPREKVDALALGLKEAVPDPSFNDEHLVALVIASRCCVVCTDDKNAILYLQRRDFYSEARLKRPKIYRYKKHGVMCSDQNVVGICR
jgi:hypothetical protein